MAARSPPASDPRNRKFLRVMVIVRSFCPYRAGSAGRGYPPKSDVAARSWFDSLAEEDGFEPSVPLARGAAFFAEARGRRSIRCRKAPPFTGTVILAGRHCRLAEPGR